MKQVGLKISVFALIFGLALPLSGARLVEGAHASDLFSGLVGAAKGYEEGAAAGRARKKAERNYEARQAMKAMAIPAGPSAWDFSRQAEPFEGEIPYHLAPKASSSPVSSLILANTFSSSPSGVGDLLERALRSRETQAMFAAHARDYGSMGEFVSDLEKLDAIDARIRYLKGNEAIDDISMIGNGWKASQLLSDHYGADIQIVVHPHNEKGQTVVTSRVNGGPINVVSREQVILELQRKFGIR